MVQIPTILVVIACKTVLAGPPDQNAAFTHYENRQWATEHSMMVCRRHEIQLFDPAEAVQLGPDHDPVPALNANFALAAQCAFYLWAGIGFLLRGRTGRVPLAPLCYFLVAINVAFLVGFVRFLGGRKETAWQRTS